MKTTLDIYGQLVTYEETDSDHSEYLDESSFGITVAALDGYFIHVNKSLNARMKSQTILHEICHAIMLMSTDWNGKYRDEQVASSLGSGLFYVLLTNVDFSKYLFGLLSSARKQI
jgi:hypothetical protein